MRFLAGNAVKCVCGPPRTPLGELTALPSAANLFTVDRRVVPAH